MQNPGISNNSISKSQLKSWITTKPNSYTTKLSLMATFILFDRCYKNTNDPYTEFPKHSSLFCRGENKQTSNI